MGISLKGRNFLTLMDFTPEEIRYLLDLAKELKAKKKAGIKGTSLTGKNIVLLFEKTSTRTRCSFEVATSDEGGYATFLDPKGSQMGKKESIADTAKVLGNAGVPVWNGLTDVDHPTQILADIMTIEEHLDKPLSEVKVVFVGDIRNNMSYAWMYGCAKMGMKFAAYGPQELADKVDAGVLAASRAVASETGAEIVVSSDPECLSGADVIYTDIWASMGEEDQIPDRVKLLTPYKVTEDMMAATGNPDCGPNSVVFDEAENRMHSIKAVIVATIGNMDS